MTVGLMILCAVAAAIGLLLFSKFKPPELYSLLLPREQAIKLAEQSILKLVGIDVSDWQRYAMYWLDRDTVNKLHHLGMLQRVRHMLYNWGLVESWRIRFIRPNQSILIGISALGEVTSLMVDIPKHRIPPLDGSQSEETAERGYDAERKYDTERKYDAEQEYDAERIRGALIAASDGIWSLAAATGSGEKTEDLQTTHTYWYTAESPELRMKLSVEVFRGRILTIDSEHEILTDDMGSAVKKEQLESTLGMSGFIGSFLAVIAAILTLIYLDVNPSLTVSIVLGVIMFASNVLTVRESVDLSIVNAYDARISVKSVAILGYLSASIAGLATGLVAFLCSLAGIGLAASMGLELFAEPARQLVIGISAGLGCLGLFAWIMHAFERRRWLATSPELSSRSIFIAGYTVKQGISMSLISSISEEAIYRLLVLSAIWKLSGSEGLAILISSVLWSIMHQTTGFKPRWVRLMQLMVFGIILGICYVQFGFLCVLVIHAVYNFVLVCLPLWHYRFNRRETSGVRPKQSVL